MTWRAVVGLVFVVAVALFLRAGDLASRPLHNDEAINAFKLEGLWKNGTYRYDPEEYHGPTLYYLAMPLARLLEPSDPELGGPQAEIEGPDEVGMRGAVVVFGIGLILATWLLADGLGGRACFAAGLGFAVSPAFVYYSRYFIHEMLLVLFAALTLGVGWRYSRRPAAAWAIAFGAGLALMYATKETFVFHVAAAAVAWVGMMVFTVEGEPRTRWRACVVALRSVPAPHAAAAVGSALVVWFLFFSSFFGNLSGPLDAFRTYFIWLERAGGASPHVHPWWFYWQRLGWFHERGAPAWTEGLLLILGLAGILIALRMRRGSLERRRLTVFLSGYFVVLAMIYSVLPYKTPWCLLGFYHALICLAGVAAIEVLDRFRGRWGRLAWVLVLLAGAAQLGWQAWRATREYAADFRNPFVYGHTSADVVNLLEQVRDVAKAHPDGRNLRMNIMAPDSNYWPLPWYLREFGQAGWWDHTPEDPYAPIVIVAARLKAGLEERSKKAWLMVGMFELRPRYFVELYVEAGLWERFLEARRAARTPGGGV